LGSTSARVTLKIPSKPDISAPESFVPALINNVPVNLLLDSGAAKNVANPHKLGLSVSNQSSSIPLLSAHKHAVPLKTCGIRPLSVQIGTSKYSVPFVLSPDLAKTAILGRPGLSQIQATLTFRPHFPTIHILDISSVDMIDPPILQEFADIFSDKPGHCSLISHSISTPLNQNPIVMKSYRTPLATTSTVEAELQEMLRLGVIKPSSSPWCSPILLIRKKDNSIRFCIDYRALNKVTEKDPYPLPQVDELRDQISNATVFSSLDLTKGYWQVPLNPADTHKIAFSANRGHYEWTHMPFGLTNAPATFQRLTDTVIRGLPGTLGYIDDILVFSQDRASHERTLRELFTRLRQAGLKVNRKKCLFFQKKVPFLGHHVSAKGVEVIPGNVAAIADFPVPNTRKQLERFLGIATYYQKFVKNLATIAFPLFQLKKAHPRSFAWLPVHQVAFDALKAALVSAPVLATPDPSLPFLLSTDASDVGVGATLEQDFSDGRRLIACASRVLSPVEQKRSTIDKEALAILWACDKFRPYLYGSSFRILTDHAPLKWLYATPRLKGRFAHWQLRLAEFEGLEGVDYLPGSSNTVPDALSRAPHPSSSVDVIGEGPPGAISTHPSPPFPSARLSPAEWKLLQESDPDFHPSFAMSSCGSYYLHDGQFFLPHTFRDKALHDVHLGKEGVHFGAQKTRDLIKLVASWPLLAADAKRFVAGCPHCQMGKAPRPARQGYQEIFSPMEPWHTLALDFMGPFPSSAKGNNFALLVLDVYTRQIYAFPLPDTTSDTAVQSLSKLFLQNGVPFALISDRAKCFVSKKFQAFCHIMGIKHKPTTPLRPTSNGMAERAIRTLKGLLRAWAHQTGLASADWASQLSKFTTPAD